MRACEGCRRRKIKCDAATTNTWPCSACVRLKLHCVPPSLNYDADAFQSSGAYDMEPLQDPANLDGAGAGRYQENHPRPQIFSGGRPSSQGTTDPMPSDHGAGGYSTSPFLAHVHGQIEPGSMSYGGVQDRPLNTREPSHRPDVMFSSPPHQTAAASATPESWQSDTYFSESLSDALGELKIDESGVGTV